MNRIEASKNSVNKSQSRNLNPLDGSAYQLQSRARETSHYFNPMAVIDFQV
jgi:hypothetical protein